jgi:DNA (cytosine-5)-methyltransferase 1
MLPERLKTHHNRVSFTDRFKVVAANLKYSHTVVAHIAKDGHYYIHPDIKQNRSITPREAARLQTFPDDFYFEAESGAPERSAAFRQIGNAVPVLMAEKIANKLLEIW